MVLRRISYFVLLIGALLLQMFSDFYLAAFVLAVVVFVPWLSLLISLPAMLGCRVRLWPERQVLRRGDSCAWIVAVDNRTKLPLSRITLHLTMQNRMFGAQQTKRLRMGGAMKERRVRILADTGRCGMLECTLDSMRVLDSMGLFSIRRKVPVAAQLPVMPQPISAPELPKPDQPQSVHLRPRPGGGPGEDYDLRAYRPGDPIRLLHWKLSSKRDELVIREVLEAVKVTPTLCFNHYGQPEDLEYAIALLENMAKHGLESGQPIRICWRHPSTGAERLYPVNSLRGLQQCMDAILSDPAPMEGVGFSEGQLPEGGYYLVGLQGRDAP